jgi:hypothetical protein
MNMSAFSNTSNIGTGFNNSSLTGMGRQGGSTQQMGRLFQQIGEAFEMLGASMSHDSYRGERGNQPCRHYHGNNGLFNRGYQNDQNRFSSNPNNTWDSNNSRNNQNRWNNTQDSDINIGRNAGNDTMKIVLNLFVNMFANNGSTNQLGLSGDDTTLTTDTDINNRASRPLVY